MTDAKRFFGDTSKLCGDLSDLFGYCPDLSGDCTGLYGDCTGLHGDCTGLHGDCTSLFGNLDNCEFEPGTDIETLANLATDPGPGGCSKEHVRQCNANMDRWSARNRELEAAWEAAANGRTDEQRLLEHLGKDPSKFDDCLAGSYVGKGENPWHRLLINLGIECYEGGYPYCEACFGSIREYIQEGSKEAYLDRLRECNKQKAHDEQSPVKGYMDRTGRVHTF